MTFIAIVTVATASLLIGAASLFVRKNKGKKKDLPAQAGEGKCDSIKELLEQKKKELAEFAKKWPEEKLKAMAQEQALGVLKKNEGAKKVIDTAENLKKKHDKLKETIELLQKRYDLCMLELPSLGKVKDLKFKGFKAKAILEGNKTATVRLFDDKDLEVGDDLKLINSDDGKVFTNAVITEVLQKKLGDIDIIDLDGHEKWNSKEEMLASFRQYYGDKINLDTMAKIVKFKIK